MKRKSFGFTVVFTRRMMAPVAAAPRQEKNMAICHYRLIPWDTLAAPLPLCANVMSTHAYGVAAKQRF
jgi:hypothetical protein